jgi:mRNA interferase YafQ
MSKYTLQRTSKFRKDYRRLKKRGYNMSLLDDVIKMLANGEALPPKHNDHPLV